MENRVAPYEARTPIIPLSIRQASDRGTRSCRLRTRPGASPGRRRAIPNGHPRVVQAPNAHPTPKTFRNEYPRASWRHDTVPVGGARPIRRLRFPACAPRARRASARLSGPAALKRLNGFARRRPTLAVRQRLRDPPRTLSAAVQTAIMMNRPSSSRTASLTRINITAYCEHAQLCRRFLRPILRGSGPTRVPSAWASLRLRDVLDHLGRADPGQMTIADRTPLDPPGYFCSEHTTRCAPGHGWLMVWAATPQVLSTRPHRLRHRRGSPCSAAAGWCCRTVYYFVSPSP